MKPLYPQPDQIEWKKGSFALPHDVAWTCAFDQTPILHELVALFGPSSKTSPSIRVVHASMAAEEFVLRVDPSGVCIESASSSGALYAVHLLAQLFDKPSRSIPCCIVSDRPRLALRGVMLDISRNKIPTLDTLIGLLRPLSIFRVNHLQLYVEGFSMESKTFPEANRKYPPFTIEMYQALETAAAEYGIELVGNQNSFGHMTEWLKLPEFKKLAECPDGFVQWGYPFPASTLNPLDPESLAFVKRLLDGFVLHTHGTFFNLNCDEPFELGRGTSKDVVAKQGVGAVYWSFVSQLIDHVRTYGKRAMVWGDVLIHHPELMDRIPADAVFLDWGYDRDYPFFDHAGVLASHRVAFVTCPGTSSWNSFAGRHEDMIQTTLNAAKAAIRHGGLGTMTTDWGDFGHLQYLPISYWGFATLGMASWSGSIDERAIEHVLDKHVFRFPNGRPSRILRDLAKLQDIEPTYVYNGTVLFRSIQFVAVDPYPLSQKVAVHKAALDQIKIDLQTEQRILNRLSSLKRRINAMRPKTQEQTLIRDELLQTIRFLRIALETNRIVTDSSADTWRRRKRLLQGIQTAVEEHRRLWRIRNLESTLDQSVLRWIELSHILAWKNETVV